MSRWARDQVPSGDELWSKVIHKIVELAVALNLDSWYYVIRNRVKVFDNTFLLRLCFSF